MDAFEKSHSHDFFCPQFCHPERSRSTNLVILNGVEGPIIHSIIQPIKPRNKAQPCHPERSRRANHPFNHSTNLQLIFPFQRNTHTFNLSTQGRVHLSKFNFNQLYFRKFFLYSIHNPAGYMLQKV